MLFNSVSYLFFFPAVVIITFLVPNKARYVWLLFASYFFYMSWNAFYGLLLFASTVITYGSAVGIDFVNSHFDGEKKLLWKKSVLTIGLAANFGMVFYFKYMNFAIRIADDILSSLHINLVLPKYDILLPVGISFFVFQAVGYMIDVYRGEVKSEKNFFRYALFVSFFPQLVAGPIERSKNLLGQLRIETQFDAYNARSGLLTMAYGLFLKIVIADNISALIDPVFGSIQDYNGMQFVFAIILFAFQIYCDFNGYSLMAVGSAEVLGYRLNRNFDSPYFASSVKDFWKRWHISLTLWFRDYLYIPIGGNKNGKLKKQLNTMAVFLCSGLWHGAAWKYVAWGGGKWLF